MNTLEELVYYCNEKEPVGALMLTGEWGCGKTYLIENDLRDKLKESHIIVRISLFGIGSIDALNETVKKQWVSKCFKWAEKLQDNNLLAAGRSIFGGASKFIPVINNIRDDIFSINPYDFVTVQPDIEDKKIVLVFDDLERTKMDTVDVLGCINEYSENQHFNTIIIANEESIKQETDSNPEMKYISYGVIKEKIVCRTIEYTPEYKTIIHSIICDKKWDAEDYKNFLKNTEEMIISIFDIGVEESGIKNKRFHNIRSLKCALQDFYRVYRKLNDAGVSDIEKYLHSFLIYTIAQRSGLAQKGEYGYLFTDDKIKKIFPNFSGKYLLRTFRDWIHDGTWNEDVINYEINLILDMTQMKSEPKDILRSSRFIDLEETVIYEGFEQLLIDCYDGDLTLDEYVEFIENSFFIRTYDIDIPVEIDWNRVYSGIKHRLEKCIIDNGDDNVIKKAISGDFCKSCLTNEEREAYGLIEQFRKNDTMTFARNRNMYLDIMNREGVKAFSVCKNLKFDVFDIEMANATTKCFDQCDQEDKAYFSSYLGGVWGSNESNEFLKRKETKDGFEKLINNLELLKTEYLQANRKIAAVHAKTLIKTVDQLSTKINEDS